MRDEGEESGQATKWPLGAVVRQVHLEIQQIALVAQQPFRGTSMFSREELSCSAKTRTIAPIGMVMTATEHPHVLIVDDDEAIRSAVRELMLSVGLDATCFASTHELLESDLHERPGCLVLDVRMPGLSGLDFQHHLAS